MESHHPVAVEPACDLKGVEADELADLEVGDSPVRDEPAKVAGAGAELFGELVDGEEMGAPTADRLCATAQGADLG